VQVAAYCTQLGAAQQVHLEDSCSLRRGPDRQDGHAEQREKEHLLQALGQKTESKLMKMAGGDQKLKLLDWRTKLATNPLRAVQFRRIRNPNGPC
jgi:hypothetical protein